MRSKLAGVIAVLVILVGAFWLGRITADEPQVSSSEVVGTEVTELQQEVADLRSRVEQNTRFRERLCSLIETGNENLSDSARVALNFAAQACEG